MRSTIIALCLALCGAAAAADNAPTKPADLEAQVQRMDDTLTHLYCAELGGCTRVEWWYIRASVDRDEAAKTVKFLRRAERKAQQPSITIERR